MSNDFPLFALSEEHQAIREAVRDLCEAKVAPYAAEVDEESRYPEEAAKALQQADFHAPHVPEEYGGAGADALATVLVIEEMQALYPAECAGKPASLPVPASQYRDFVRWQAELLAGAEGERHGAFWQQQLASGSARIGRNKHRPWPRRWPRPW